MTGTAFRFFIGLTTFVTRLVHIKETDSGFEPITNRSPRHNLTATFLLNIKRIKSVKVSETQSEGKMRVSKKEEHLNCRQNKHNIREHKKNVVETR